MQDGLVLAGYTITYTHDDLRISYCHCSPNFLVSVGQKVSRGQVIGQVGPKNVYDIPNNPYKDSNGNPTNRCYDWSTFTYYNKKRRQSRQSFKIFIIIVHCCDYRILGIHYFRHNFCNHYCHHYSLLYSSLIQ